MSSIIDKIRGYLQIRYTVTEIISIIAAVSAFDFPVNGSEDLERIQTANPKRRQPIRIILTELKWSEKSVSQSANSVLVCCLQSVKTQQDHQ